MRPHASQSSTERWTCSGSWPTSPNWNSSSGTPSRPSTRSNASSPTWRDTWPRCTGAGPGQPRRRGPTTSDAGTPQRRTCKPDSPSCIGSCAPPGVTTKPRWRRTCGCLDAAQGMAGNDKAAATFTAHYDPAAKAVWSAFGAGIRTLAGVANGLVTTANNYLKAEAHSTAGGSQTPQEFSPPAVVYDVMMPDPAPSKGDGDSDVTEFLQKFWPKSMSTTMLKNSDTRLRKSTFKGRQTSLRRHKRRAYQPAYHRMVRCEPTIPPPTPLQATTRRLASFELSSNQVHQHTGRATRQTGVRMSTGIRGTNGGKACLPSLRLARSPRRSLLTRFETRNPARILRDMFLLSVRVRCHGCRPGNNPGALAPTVDRRRNALAEH